MRPNGKVALLGLGLLLAVAGNYLANLCTWSYDGLCVTHGYLVPGAVLEILAALVVGVAIIWLLGPSGFLRYPEIRVYCTVCGHRLDWEVDSEQWYCAKCGQFRLRQTYPQPHHYM